MTCARERWYGSSRASGSPTSLRMRCCRAAATCRVACAHSSTSSRPVCAPHVLRDDIATTDELFAVICMYVLIAMLWACLYWTVKYFQPGAFYVNAQNNPDARVTWWDLLYFSFTTLTSVGYGEITPVTSHARSLVMLEQIAGIMYVALLVARLTSMSSRRERRAG